MIEEAGAEYVIIGHSERRRLFGETDAIVNRKTGGRARRRPDADRLRRRNARGARAERDAGVLDRQIKDGLDGVTGDQLARSGHRLRTGVGDRHREERHGRRRPARRTRTSATRLRQWFGAEAADHCRILYGGSVKPDNIRQLIAEPDVDGALVGGASLDVKAFAEIVYRTEPGRCGIIQSSQIKDMFFTTRSCVSTCSSA